ncbi:MAG TPA: hypothetical protein VFU12_07400 [Glycomyces sp.]|nr:hypothetical protein [Glycomyces sp.]
MVKGTNRAYKVVPVEDEPDFGDPPRNWARVASMAGAWALLLLGTAWVAPGFASGGGEEETDVRDQAPTTPRQAVARYLEAGLGGDSGRVEDALCDDASPEVSESELVALRSEYEEQPEIEISTSEPVGSATGMEVAAQVSFIGASIFYEDFTVTVLATGDSYCVDQVTAVDSEDDGPVTEVDPQDQAARFLSAVFTVRDVEAASGYLCEEFEGSGPEALASGLNSWEARLGESTAVQGFEGDPVSSPTGTTVPMSVELSSGQAVESFSFEITVEADCVSAVSGGEALLDPPED